MNQEEVRDLSWPRWEWKFNEQMGAISGVVGIVGAIAAYTTGISSSLWLGIVLFLSCLLTIPFFQWVGRTIRIAYQRIRWYQRAYAYVRQQDANLSQTGENLLLLASFFTEFEIKRVLFVIKTSKVYIVLNRSSPTELVEGDKVLVVDEETPRLMGEFVIKTVRSSEYIAIGTSIDPLWLGFIHNEGKTELYPPPNTIAVCVKE